MVISSVYVSRRLSDGIKLAKITQTKSLRICRLSSMPRKFILFSGNPDKALISTHFPDDISSVIYWFLLKKIKTKGFPITSNPKDHDRVKREVSPLGVGRLNRSPTL